MVKRSMTLFVGQVVLTEAFDHIKDNTLIANNSSEEIKLKHNTIFGREITSNAKLAKMNMILHGDGHSGICQIDTLQNPIESEYDVVITNMPFSQKLLILTYMRIS